MSDQSDWECSDRGHNTLEQTPEPANNDQGEVLFIYKECKHYVRRTRSGYLFYFSLFYFNRTKINSEKFYNIPNINQS